MSIASIVEKSEALMQRPYQEVAPHLHEMVDRIQQWLAEPHHLTIVDKKKLEDLLSRLQKHSKQPNPPAFLGGSTWNGS